MVDVGVGVGVMPAPRGNPVNLSLLNRGKQEEDKNRTVVTPETQAARNYPPNWPALTALSTVGNRTDHRIGSSSLGGSGGRCSFQQPGNHGGDHLNVTHCLGRDVHDQVLSTCPASGSSSPGTDTAWQRSSHPRRRRAAPAACAAYTGSGLSGLESNCRRAVWTNMDSSSPCEARRSPAGAGCLQGHCLTRVALPSRPRDRYAPAPKISAIRRGPQRDARFSLRSGLSRLALLPPDTSGGKEWSLTGGGIHSISTMVATAEMRPC